MTFTVDPGLLGFLFSVICVIFVAGGGWAGLHLTVRWLEKKQDIKLEALKESLELEFKAIREAHDEHVERYEREQRDLRSKVDAKSESVTDLTAWRAQFEKRIDEKFVDFKESVTAQFKSLAQSLRQALEDRPRPRVAVGG